MRVPHGDLEYRVLARNGVTIGNTANTLDHVRAGTDPTR